MASTTILSDNGASSGSAGIKTTGGNDGTLLLQTTTAGGAATTALAINTSQNVGIGTSSPAEKLQLIGSLRISNSGTFYSTTYSAGNSQTWMVNNATSGDIFLTSDTAQRYRQLTGVGHVWETAASGTAGGAVSFTERMRIDSNGNTGFGRPANGYGKLAILFDPTNASNNYCGLSIDPTAGTSGAKFVQFYNEAGSGIASISRNGTSNAVLYNTTSDYRLKENIEPLSGALDRIAALKPVQWVWKGCNGETGEGFVAHEVQAVVPGAVNGEKDDTEIQLYEITAAVQATYDEEGNELTPAIEAVMGEREVPKYQGMDASYLVATLTAAIQEQQALITTLTERITALEAK